MASNEKIQKCFIKNALTSLNILRMHIMSTKLGLGVNTSSDKDSIKMIHNYEVEKKVKHVRKKLTYLKGHLLTSNEFNRCGTSHAG